MPYIKQENREKYNMWLDNWPPDIDTKGDLEYCIFKLMLQYMHNRTYTYTQLHECIYAVQHCAHEFERRWLDKREDKALIENGDVA